MRFPWFKFTVAAMLAMNAWAASALSSVTGMRLASQPEKTRLVLELTATTAQKIFTLTNPARVVIDLPATSLLGKLPAGVGLVNNLRAAKRENGDLRIVLDVRSEVTPKVTWLAAENGTGPRLVIDLPASKSAASATSIDDQKPAPATEASPVAAPAAVPVTLSAPQATKSAASQSHARDLIIAIDAGHGGEDPGASGHRGTKEKDVTLAIAQLLKQRIDAELGMRAVLTRDGDYFVPLGERVHRARQQQADMFVSIHADAVENAGPSGSSVYTLSSKRATSEAARYLADRENAADLLGGVSLEDKSNVLASVLLNLTQGASMSASMEAASHVLEQLDHIGNIHHQQVQQASFKVLTSPDIPSMLVETAFITNPAEEQRLADPLHQARIADAVLTGIRDYFYSNSPPGTRVAQLKLTRQARN